MARDHTKGDTPVDTEEVRESQRVMTAIAKSLGNIFDLGTAQSWSNYERCIDNCGSEAHDVPSLRILPKVHKPPGADGHLQSRPVVSAAAGISSRAGDQMADFLTPLVATQNPRMEDLSTEEVMAQLKETQEMIRETRATNVMAGSLDVRALYPSLDQEGSARIVSNHIKNTTANIVGIDWNATQIFVASNMDEHKIKREGLLSLVPRRRKKRGKRPGQTTEELFTNKRNPQIETVIEDETDKVHKKKVLQSKWEDTVPEDSLSDDNKRLLLAMVMLIATRLIFKYHVYSFAGEVYRQARGGPIGLRFMSIVARIIRREGVNYSLQCLDCALEGVDATYWGESGLSARQRHRNHSDQVDRGDVNNPMLLHSISVHGGKRPNYLSLIDTIEPRPLYRAIRESVQISSVDPGPLRLNRCQEWEAPRIPILTATGGDGPPQRTRPDVNLRPEWTLRVQQQI